MRGSQALKLNYRECEDKSRDSGAFPLGVLKIIVDLLFLECHFQQFSCIPFESDDSSREGALLTKVFPDFQETVEVLWKIYSCCLISSSTVVILYECVKVIFQNMCVFS